MKRLGVFIAGLALVFAGLPAHAEVTQQNKGLFVTPVREYVTVGPDKILQKQLTVANNTDQPVRITFSVQQFSVTDYRYDFIFKTASEDWITFAQPQIDLQPGKSFVQTYSIAPPASAVPGGHYFTLIATASSAGSAITNKVQAAMTLYTTVEGPLHLTTAVQKVTVPRVSFGGDIDFALDVRNTGNTHFFVYASGQLEGLTTKGKGPESTHLLMPNTVRTIGSSIPAPLLPGIYNAAFGYTADNGQTVLRSQHIVFVPVWSLFVVAGVVWLVVVLVRRRRRLLLAFGHHRVRHR